VNKLLDDLFNPRSHLTNYARGPGDDRHSRSEPLERGGDEDENEQVGTNRLEKTLPTE
jgi:hypothetical protein